MFLSVFFLGRLTRLRCRLRCLQPKPLRMDYSGLPACNHLSYHRLHYSKAPTPEGLRLLVCSTNPTGRVGLVHGSEFVGRA